MTSRSSMLHIALLLALAGGAQAQLIGTWPTPATPVGNPPDVTITQLGKTLFWDEQLSFDGTTACGTCHFFSTGGNDANGGVRHPGDDGVFFTADDNFGSPGVIRQDASGDYVHDPDFGVNPQVTGRNAPTQVGAAFFFELFWDKRAGPDFQDELGVTIPGFAANAALEDQVVEPPVSPVEMGHDNIVWSEVSARLINRTALKLATNVPPDIAPFQGRRYTTLFNAAFGPSPSLLGIASRERVARAIAQYMRTLVPDQAPIDGGINALSPQARAGFLRFRDIANCDICHSQSGNMATDPAGFFLNPNDNMFSDGQFHNINLPGHSRFVKAPTLRNVALRKNLFHSGQAVGLVDAMNIQYLVKLPPLGFGPLPLAQVQEVLAFFRSLTDPRVAAELPPFDRPQLFSEGHPLGSNQFGPGSAGSGGFVPTMISNSPEFIGNDQFKIGLGTALGGAPAVLGIAKKALPGQNIGGVPVEIDLSTTTFVSFTTTGFGPGVGTATHHAPIAALPGLIGTEVFFQWFVADPAAPGGRAASPASRHKFF